MSEDLSNKQIHELKETQQQFLEIKTDLLKQLSFKSDPFEIAEIKNNIKKCEEHLDKCKRHLESRKLEIIDKLLHHFNFTTQKQPFNEYWRKLRNKGLGAFLIHGEEYAGQNWLFQRLLHKAQIKTENITIEPKKCRCPHGIVGLLKVLATSLKVNAKLSDNPSFTEIQDVSKQIVETIRLRLQKGSLAICLINSLDFLDTNVNPKICHFREKDHIQLFIELLWEKLWVMLQKENIPNKLVFFLLEDKEHPESLPYFANTVDEGIDNGLPIQLPPIEQVCETYIHDWTVTHIFESEHQQIFEAIHHFGDKNECKQCVKANQFLSPIDFFYHIHQECNNHTPYGRY